MTTNLDRILEKVRAMLALADHPATPAAEADLARVKAEDMMRKYRIEESQLSFEERALGGIRPVKRTIRLCRYSSEFTTEIWSLAYWAANHVEGRIVQAYERDAETGELWLTAIMYGFESDIRYAEAIFTASQVTFSARLEPQVNKAESDQVNCYRMRSAGMERNRIAQLLWGSALTDGPAHGKVQRLYKAEAAARGEDAAMAGKGTNAKTFRSSYAAAFVNGIYTRLWRLREQRAADSTGEMVLASRKSEVDELFYTDFPDMRPSADPMPSEQSKKAPKKIRTRKFRSAPYNGQAAAIGRDAASRVDLTGGNVPRGERRMDRQDQNQIGG